MRVGQAFKTAASQALIQEEESTPGICSYRSKCIPVLYVPRRKGHPMAHSRDAGLFEEESSLPLTPSDSLLPPRGFRDFPPSIFAIHKYIFSVWHRVAGEFGFQEYKGPSVERSSLYSHFVPTGAATANTLQTAGSTEGNAAKSCAKIPPHIYRLQGDGKEALCLRPELTPSLARILQREQLVRPSGLARRWYSIERVWRHERPGCGRRREHFQWNLDIAFPSHSKTSRVAGPDSTSASPGHGVRDHEPNEANLRDSRHFSGDIRPDFAPYATAELIAAAVRLFQLLGLTPADVRIRVGSRALLCDLLRTQMELRTNGGAAAVSGQQRTSKGASSFLGQPPIGVVPLEGGTRDAFPQRLLAAMQVLDRAGRRSRAQTGTALVAALGISSEASSCILERLHSFDVNDDAMVQDLAERLRGLAYLGSAANGVPAGPSMAENSHGTFQQQMPASVREMRLLLQLLEQGYGVSEWIDLDLLIVRGLHYYTGLVFEAFDADGALRAVLGGGSYEVRRAFPTITGKAAETHFLTAAPDTPGIVVPSASLEMVDDCAAGEASERERRTGSITGVGFGMGDCVLLELLQRKRVLPVGGSTVDVVVVLRHKARAQRSLGEDPGGATVYRGSNKPSRHLKEQSRDNTSASLSAVASVPHIVEAQKLCSTLRNKGLRVELLLPPQQSERASIRHARSLGAKALVFVSSGSGSRPVAGQEEHTGHSVCLRSPGQCESCEHGSNKVTGVDFQVRLLEPGGVMSSVHSNKYRDRIQAGEHGAKHDRAIGGPREVGSSKGVKIVSRVPFSVVTLLMNWFAKQAGPSPSPPLSGAGRVE